MMNREKGMSLKRRRASPKFVEGEMVRVKSRDSVLESTGLTHKLDGCLFMEQMWNYCGKTYQVLKVINSLFNERMKRTVKPRATLYILDNLICEGITDNFSFKCDHSCFLLWHEQWLEKTL